MHILLLTHIIHLSCEISLPNCLHSFSKIYLPTLVGVLKKGDNEKKKRAAKIKGPWRCIAGVQPAALRTRLCTPLYGCVCKRIYQFIPCRLQVSHTHGNTFFGRLTSSKAK